MEDKIFVEKEFEPVLIKAILRKNAEVCTLVPYLRSNYFTKADCAAIINSIQSLYSSLGTIPTIGMLRDHIQKNESSEVKVSALNFLSSLEENLSQIQTGEINDHEKYVFQNTKDFIKQNKMVEAIKESIDDVQKGDFAQVYERIRKADVVSALGDIGLPYFDKSCHRSEFLETVPTGYSFFNKVLGGGYPKKTLITLAGAQKSGKSMMLVNMAFRACFKKRKVAFFTFELSEAMQKIRFDSIITDQRMLITGKQDAQIQHQAIVDSALDMITDPNGEIGMPKNSLFIKEFATGMASMRDVRAYLDLLNARYDFSPDVIVLDYIDHALVNSIQKVKDNDPWLKEGAIYTEARALGVDYNAAILTAMQRTKDSGNAFNDEELEASLGGSVSKSQIADALFIISQSKSEERLNQIRISTWFNRFGESRKGEYTNFMYTPGKARYDEITPRG